MVKQFPLMADLKNRMLCSIFKRFFPRPATHKSTKGFFSVLNVRTCQIPGRSLWGPWITMSTCGVFNFELSTLSLQQFITIQVSLLQYWFHRGFCFCKLWFRPAVVFVLWPHFFKDLRIVDFSVFSAFYLFLGQNSDFQASYTPYWNTSVHF